MGDAERVPLRKATVLSSGFDMALEYIRFNFERRVVSLQTAMVVECANAHTRMIDVLT